MYPLPLEPPSHPAPQPTHLVITEQRAELPVLYSNFPSTILCLCVYVSANLPIVPPSLSQLCPRVCSLHLYLYSCPANRFICTIFLDSNFLLRGKKRKQPSFQIYKCRARSPFSVFSYLERRFSKVAWSLGSGFPWT